jgi:hypothetical protein
MKTNDNYGAQSMRSHGEISRLLTAAVINEGFRKMLLSNPELALTRGYKGESFHLSKEERTHLVFIRATSLTDFAAQIPQF